MKHIYLLIFLPFMVMACHNDHEKGQIEETYEVPPSLREDQKSVAVITLSEKESSELNIKTIKVEKGKNSFIIVTSGITEPAPDYFSIISTPVNGRIIRINANEGEYVKKGQVIMDMESLEYGLLVSDYLKASAEADYYENRYERIRQLVEKSINPESELEQVLSDYRRAATTRDAAVSMLRAVGIGETEIDLLKTNNNINPVLKIISPISGVINENLVELGQSVNAYDKMASVINTEKILVKAFISPEEGQRVNPGDSVEISKRNLTGNPLTSIVSTINPSLDLNNRSLVANILVRPVDKWPLAGENVRIKIKTSGEDEVISIPVQAITYDNDNPVVFVRKEERIFEKRVITIRGLESNDIVVTSGLNENEEIAVSQIFSLKALARYDIYAD